jgi:hypothetical protein
MRVREWRAKHMKRELDDSEEQKERVTGRQGNTELSTSPHRCGERKDGTKGDSVDRYRTVQLQKRSKLPAFAK